ncbi:efflux RND transporter permease subunit [Pelomonas aquatica]|jgi:predicted RND superfamily exporter protein|uniref:RND family transporter n=1 Tax=Pelomonas aquatica TaxID=431058 RepID=A0A9X4LQD9_9BURK|nr:efflux RND transporter permease subunit [Pelomonas aquatica]MCY4757142.1 efflux RND transporter permease subunit [Pelomonas aquatica]MDG0864578.1 RND family transporter [Pelomonas aquatica]
MNLKSFVAAAERWLFLHRAWVLGLLAAVTVVFGMFALKLHLEAGYEKQIPLGHEYVEVLHRYAKDLPGTNRLSFVVKARQGSIWTKEGLTRLFQVTEAVTLLPNVDRAGVRSLWTPNSFVNEITEEGFRAQPIIPGTIVPEALDAATIAQIQASTSQGGFVGVLVSQDQSAAMITAELYEVDPQGQHLDYVAYNAQLEGLRQRFEDDHFEVQIIGFAKQVGDIAEGAASVIRFFGLAIVLTIGAVYWYCHSWRFTLLPIACSFTSLVWQFGTLRLMGYGLDPLAVLVPFLVFAIGVSHGVQQINFIVRGLAHGKSTEQASRDSFSGLLIPGMLALLMALVSFVTLLLIPIPMIRELAITASIGVGFKIITNLVMLPLAASYLHFGAGYSERAMAKRSARARIIRTIAVVARPRTAIVVTLLSFGVLGLSAWQSRDRIVGTLQPGAPELREDSRFNRDAVAIASNFDMGLDWLTVVFEGSGEPCSNTAIGRYMDAFVSHMRSVPGVVSIDSYSGQLRTYNQGYNEGLPKMDVVPADPANYAALSAELGRVRGYNTKDCRMTAAHLYLADHKATTINGVTDAVKRFSKDEPAPKDARLRLAAGNAGVLAATNEELERSELPMMLYVYATIVVLVLLVYRDVRAAIACCFPLTVATFIGYWFMKSANIGLTVATLPVMVLAVGIGVDYALYIYNRLQMHLADGDPIHKAMEKALEFEGMATIFTAITLAVGVATWSFSDLKFQADMGKLLAFMFLVNLIMAFTALPALAVVLERVFKRRKPAYAPSVLVH